MAEPATMVIAASATAVAIDTAMQEISKAYAALKALLVRTFSGDSDVVEAVDHVQKTLSAAGRQQTAGGAGERQGGHQPRAGRYRRAGAGQAAGAAPGQASAHCAGGRQLHRPCRHSRVA